MLPAVLPPLIQLPSRTGWGGGTLEESSLPRGRLRRGRDRYPRPRLPDLGERKAAGSEELECGAVLSEKGTSRFGPIQRDRIRQSWRRGNARTASGLSSRSHRKRRSGVRQQCGPTPRAAVGSDPAAASVAGRVGHVTRQPTPRPLRSLTGGGQVRAPHATTPPRQQRKPAPPPPAAKADQSPPKR